MSDEITTHIDTSGNKSTWRTGLQLTFEGPREGWYEALKVVNPVISDPGFEEADIVCDSKAGRVKIKASVIKVMLSGVCCTRG